MDAVRLHPSDNVVTATKPLEIGADIDGVQATALIPRGHKVATTSIAKGTAVLKYAQIIGYAGQDIAAGDHVHTHNLEFRAVDQAYEFATDLRPVSPASGDTFMGYQRENGKVGTRNTIAILTSVNCSATVAGVLMVGLGCEMNQIDWLIEAYGLKPGPLFQAMNIQDVAGLQKTVEIGVDKVTAMLPLVNDFTRTPCPASELMVALQCGGSDAWSGITANPALGYACDLLVAQGGTGVLAETPEIYGAEHLLTRRAVDETVGKKLIGLIDWWEDYTARNKGSMDNNPSPGNKKGGLTTILEKSLGAAAKGGTTPLTGVYKYAEPVTARGFTFMDSPGYDPASVTGQIASGCNLVCFTTGRGSAFGAKPSPSIKIATNSEMYGRMIDDMDVDAGRVLGSVDGVEAVGREIYETFLRVASGEMTKSEAQGLGDYEFVPWQIGAVM